MAEKYYGNTSFTLVTENRSLDTLVFHPTKPVLDSELNGISDLASEKLKEIVRNEVPSGWLDAVFTVGHDNTYSTYGVNTTDIPNTIFLNTLKAKPFHAIVNGWSVQVGGSSVANDSIVRVTLPVAPSSGGREDLVFLEVWKTELHSNSTTNKPALNQIFKYGNTQYAGTNPADEIVNASVGFETSSRVQLQYRIRIIPGVNFVQNPEGMTDSYAVYAQGGAAAPASTYNFVSAGPDWNDYGLYIAGDGSSTSAANLNTVDGYVYAIPMFRIHRRNTAAYSFQNTNGSSVSVLSGNASDRPDGLFYDTIDALDIEDLRHKVTFGNFNHQELLQHNYSNTLAGRNNTFLTSLQNSLHRASEGFQIDAIALSPPTGVTPTYYPNGQIRYFSDVAGSLPVTVRIPAPPLGWQSTSTTTNYVSVKNYSPNGTTIDTSSPPVVMFAASSSGPVVTLPNAYWSNLDPENPTITLGTLSSTSASGLEGNSQDIYVMYSVLYPQVGNKLTKPITSMLDVRNTAASEQWGFVSVNDLDLSTPMTGRLISTPTNSSRRLRKIAKRVTNGFEDYAYTYRVSGPNTYHGVGTVYSYYMNGNSGTNYTIPGNLINLQDAGYILRAYIMSSPNTPVSIVFTNRDPSTFAITATLPVIVSPGDTIRFDVVLLGGVLEFDERTQSVTDMGYVDLYEIQGNNTNTLVLDKSCLNSKIPSEIMIGAQKELVGSSYDTACYINNQRSFCTTTVVSGSPLVILTFANPVLSSSKVSIALYSKRTLTTLDSLCISYNYKAYKGITQKLSATDVIQSKLLHSENSIDIVTNGTGAVNTAATLPKSHENLIGVLPHPTVLSFNTGNFTGTVHTKRPVIGGSYAYSSRNTPYTAGEENYISMVGNSCTQGTNVGGMFCTTADLGAESGTTRISVASLLEMVTSDTSKNCLPGELVLKLETNYILGSSLNQSNQITNSSTGSTSNTFDIFKLEGRPLYKVRNK